MREEIYSPVPSCAIIREDFSDRENIQDSCAQQLELALEFGYNVIIIEEHELGDETARWISVGNCLHKTAVITGIGTLAIGLFSNRQPYELVSAGLGLISVLCTGIYMISWQFDPCCKYQVENDPKQLMNLPWENVIVTSPIVLVRKDDTRRKILHCSISMLALFYSLCHLRSTWTR